MCDNGIKAEWDNELWGIKISENNEDSNRIKCSVNFKITLSNYIMYQLANDPSVIKEEHEETDQTGANAKTDYRYVGANPNNYVCLEESGQCTNAQLYRIIGVIPTQKDDDGDYENRVKLVKYTSIGSYQWSGQSGVHNNNWIASNLNNQILNVDYWGQINSYHKYIDSAKWYLGGVLSSEFLTSEFYKSERGNVGGKSSPEITFTVKNIGLIYPSDYGYATNGGSVTRDACLARTFLSGSERNNWVKDDYTDCITNDWLKSGGASSWTITPHSDISDSPMAYTITTTGIGSDGTGMSYGLATYPSFYLKVGVKYLSGTGEKNNPYRIMID